MGLTILHSADWHLDSPFISFRQDQRTFLKQAQLQIPGKIAALCRRENCDLVLLAGDLFDGPWSRDTLDLVRNALEDCGCPVMISPGNHDPWGPESPWMETWPQNVHIFKSEIQSVLLKELDCRVYGAGFSQMDCRSLLEGFHAEGEETWKIGVFHGDPTNGSSPYNPVTTAQIRQSGLTYLALGHVHSAGGLEVQNTVCGWPGCPMGRGWDETGEKGCILVKLGNDMDVRPVSLNLPAFYQHTMEINRENPHSLEEILPPAGNRNFYRITLTGYGKPDLKEIYKNYLDFPNLELRDQCVDSEKIWEQAGEDSLRGVYFGKLREEAESADEDLRKKILLAAEISQKLLEGREVQLP